MVKLTWQIVSHPMPTPNPRTACSEGTCCGHHNLVLYAVRRSMRLLIAFALFAAPAQSLKVAWFHPPKTGTSFGTTLFQYASKNQPQHLPATARMSTCDVNALPGAGDPVRRPYEAHLCHGATDSFFQRFPLNPYFRGVSFWPPGVDVGRHVAITQHNFDNFVGHARARRDAQAARRSPPCINIWLFMLGKSSLQLARKAGAWRVRSSWRVRPRARARVRRRTRTRARLPLIGALDRQRVGSRALRTACWLVCAVLRPFP